MLGEVFWMAVVMVFGEGSLDGCGFCGNQHEIEPC